MYQHGGVLMVDKEKEYQRTRLRQCNQILEVDLHMLNVKIKKS